MEAGRELDALIAEKVMGWKPSNPGTCLCSLRERCYCYTPKSYSTDIAAALSALEHLCAQRSLWYTLEGGDRDGPYTIDIRGAGQGEHWHIKRAYALPWGICLAALKAVGG
jgi:hypothetical protein